MLSIQERETRLIAREKQIIKIERQICRQQQILVEMIQKMSAKQNAISTKIPTVSEVMERFVTKMGHDSEESRRKCNALLIYMKAAGISPKDAYSKLHNEKALLKIVQAISGRTDIRGDQKVRHVRWVKEFIKFATVAYPDLYKPDVLIGLPAIKRTPKSARCPHTPYSDVQLKHIFSPKKDFFLRYPDLFWGCMIALFTGSRKNAVFTLQHKDIIQRDGIWCINFIADCPGFKHLKTEDSERIVPVHSTLIKMGFLDFVARKHPASETEFIFKKICLTAKGTLNSHIVGKFFHFLEQIGVRGAPGGRYDFHSFRKNTNIMMEKCGILRSYIDKIIGWKSQGSEGERSYSNYTIRQISDQLELLHYDCLRSEFKQWKKIMAKIPC